MTVTSASRLSEQMPSALRELLEGLSKAREGEAGAPGDLHASLVRTLLRLIFILYAEARGLLTLDDGVSLTRLVDSPAAEPAPSSTKAWRAIVNIFHAVRGRYELSHDHRLFAGRCHVLESMPIDDMTVHRMLEKLTSIDEEDGPPLRVAYQALEIEHLGGLYEAMMGFDVEEVRQPSLMVSTRKAGSLPVDVIVGLSTLLELSREDRVAYLAKLGVTVTRRGETRLRAAMTLDDLATALGGGPRLPIGALALRRTENRRRSGSHYTSPALAEDVVRRALTPIFENLGPDRRPEQILALTVCDPAMGSGAFLLAACRVLAEELVSAWERHGLPAAEEGVDLEGHARRLVAERCLYGVDKDAIAVELARLSLWLLAGGKDCPFGFADEHLRHGDSLVDRPLSLLDRARDDAPFFSWENEFPDVFSENGAPGFDAMVGNPPWISYAGRAAQPLAPSLKAHFADKYDAFSGYRNLQGLFVERAAKLLRPGGRLGFVLPSSMSEQDGYGPTRLAHDRLCEVDESLPDLGEDSFAGVVQPCMVLLSTRRATKVSLQDAKPWPVERPDLDEVSRAIVAKMSLPPLPAHLFGERGLQTLASEAREMTSAPTSRHTVPLRAGGDVLPFRRRSPSYYADPTTLKGRLRPKEAFASVRLLIRQTARVPMVALSDGLAFRNSVLAGFEDDDHPASFLVAYLNSSPIRWLHYMRHRDARQGLPQIKIGHLRSLPVPPNHKLVDALSRIGAELSAKNEGIDEAMQRRIDDLVADAFDLSLEERERIRELSAIPAQRSR